MCYVNLFCFAISWNRGVSGLAMDILLANEINRRFEAQGHSKAMEGLDAARARRSRAKLLREASRVKTILSANSDHVAQVCSLHCIPSFV